MDPVRETPKAHECVCLLIKSPERTPEIEKTLREAAEAAGVPAALIPMITSNEDKCKHMVDSPDQPFCDGCEDAGHPQAPTQRGMRNIVKENKE